MARKCQAALGEVLRPKPWELSDSHQLLVTPLVSFLLSIDHASVRASGRQGSAVCIYWHLCGVCGRSLAAIE